MTRVDFYILADDIEQGREHFACRLADKAYQLGHQIHIQASSEDQARRLDELLWSYRAGSFLPHAMIGNAEPVESPIMIGFDEQEPQVRPDVMINLAHPCPGYFSRFERVAEITNQDEQQKQFARERFRFYRDRGYELQHHNVK